MLVGGIGLLDREPKTTPSSPLITTPTLQGENGVAPMRTKSTKTEFSCKYIEPSSPLDKDGGGHSTHPTFAHHLFTKTLMTNKYKLWVAFIY